MIEQQTSTPMQGDNPSFDKAECNRAAKLIAEELNENTLKALAQIYKIVKAIGPDQALDFLQKTKDLEAAGGVLTLDGSRRRSPGGAFFFLVHGKYPDLRERRFQNRKRTANTHARVAEAKPKEQPAPQTKEFMWNDRIAALDAIGIQKGHLATVKITLIGRPGKIIDRGTCIVTSMKNTKVPALPKGVPSPSTFQTNYVVYIASKQWKTVAETINDEDDMLIIDGFPQLDPETSSIAVFATNTTTKKLQAAKRSKQEQ